MGRFLFVTLGLLVVAFSLNGIGANLDCPSSWVSYNVSCYKLFKRMMTWNQAQMYCAEQQENCQLASINEVGESVKLSDELSQRLEVLDVWMGLSKTKGNWKWSDGSNFTYTSWDEGEPDNFLDNEFCAALSAQSRYQSQSERHVFYSPGKVLRLENVIYDTPWEERGNKVIGYLRWNDQNCMFLQPFVCKFKPRSQPENE